MKIISYILAVLILLILVCGVFGEDIKKDNGDKFLITAFEKQVVIDSKDGIKSNSISDYLSTSIDNSLAVFHTWATNLGSDKRGIKTYIKDIENDQLVFTKENARFPSMSPDGKYVVYEYVEDYENDLPAIYLYDVRHGSESFIGYTSGGNAYGWKSQVFEWENSDTVRYQTSYGGGGWKNMTYIVGAKI